MEIVRNKIFITKTYDEIEPGDVFAFDENYFLKMDTDESVDLADGTTFKFISSTKVKVVSARLIITENY